MKKVHHSTRFLPPNSSVSGMVAMASAVNQIIAWSPLPATAVLIKYGLIATIAPPSVAGSAPIFIFLSM